MGTSASLFAPKYLSENMFLVHAHKISQRTDLRAGARTVINIPYQYSVACSLWHFVLSQLVFEFHVLLLSLNSSGSLLKPFLPISKSQLPLCPFLADSKAAALVSHSAPLGPLLRGPSVYLLGVLLNGAQLDELSTGITECHRSNRFLTFRRTGSVRAVPSEVISFRFHVVPLTVWVKWRTVGKITYFNSPPHIKEHYCKCAGVTPKAVPGQISQCHT